MAVKKTAPKKAAPKKSILKKAGPKKTALKKVKPGKASTLKTKPGRANPKEIIPQIAMEETPASGDCMCKQKRPDGQYYCFRLEQGRWVQSSGVPFPTQELCEEANC